MMAEQEARVRICPHLRPDVEHETMHGIDRYAVLRHANCVASDCMMWRRAETREFTAKAEDAFRKFGTRLVADTGYCGLAGVPVTP